MTPARINATDLPKGARTKALATAGQRRPAKEEVRRARPARTPSPRPLGEVPPRWRCHTCTVAFAHYAPAERHVDTAHRHGRIEWQVAA